MLLLYIPETVSTVGGTSSCVSDTIHVINVLRFFPRPPLHFDILQAIKNQTV